MNLGAHPSDLEYTTNPSPLGFPCTASVVATGFRESISAATLWTIRSLTQS